VTHNQNLINFTLSQVSQIAFIAEFTLKCAGGGEQTFPLFAEVAGKIAPVVRIGENNYQVSWSEDVKKARSGNHEIRLYDEAGYAAVRRSSDSVAPLTKFSVYYSGAYNGAFINSEFLAIAASFVTVYVALTTRSKLVN
jgi:translocon-associated protein subunit delta